MIKRLLFIFMLLFSHLSVSAGVTDLRLSTAQIFDVQWSISGGRLNASGFNYIYSSVNYATQTTSAARWTAAQTSDANSNGRYISFFNSTTNPGTYGMAVFNSNGSVYKIINNTGSFRALADGAIFYNGNGMWGTLITTGQGYNNGQSGNWAVTQDNPNNSQLQAYTPPSSTPLAAGQTAGPSITSTNTTYSTRTTTSGSTTYNYRTPTTVNTYSDNTTTTTTGSESLYTTAVTSTQTSSKQFGNRTINYSIPVVTTTTASTGASTTAPVTPATLPSSPVSVVSYTGGGGWQIKSYTYTAAATGTGYLMFAFRHDVNYWVIDNVSVKANNTGANLLVNGGLEQSGMMTVNVGGVEQTVAAPTAWGLAYQTNQSPTLGGGFDSGMWYDTSTGSYGSIYQNINFTAGVTYTISFMVASDYNSNGSTIQMAVYAGACDGSGSGCVLPSSTGMTTAVTPSETYNVGCAPNCPVNSTPQGPSYPSYVTIGSGTAGTMEFGTSANITTPQQTRLTNWTNKTIPNGNQIYIDQVYGDGNTVTMDQNGNKNLINATLGGTNNTIKANQGVPGIGQNEMKLNFEGNNNNVNLNQARDTQGNALGTNGHYLDATIAGWGVNLTVQQSNTGGVGGHYNETTINGNGNNVIAKQTENGNKIMFLKVDGALNTVEAVQKGIGQHRLDATITGNLNSATVLQEGTVANNATINLTNAGGPASVIVNQTGGQSVSVTTSCATAGGCAPITVRQGY